MNCKKRSYPLCDDPLVDFPVAAFPRKPFFKLTLSSYRYKSFTSDSFFPLLLYFTIQKIEIIEFDAADL